MESIFESILCLLADMSYLILLDHIERLQCLVYEFSSDTSSYLVCLYDLTPFLVMLEFRGTLTKYFIILNLYSLWSIIWAY